MQTLSGGLNIIPVWFDCLSGNERLSMNLLVTPKNRDLRLLFSLFFRNFREWKSKKIFGKRVGYSKRIRIFATLKFLTSGRSHLSNASHSGFFMPRCEPS